MTTLFTTLAALILVMGSAIFIMGSVQAFNEEFKKADFLISHSIATEASYKQAKRLIDIIYRMTFRNRRKTDELIKLFYKKYKFLIFIDFEISKSNFYHRLVKLTA